MSRKDKDLGVIPAKSFHALPAGVVLLGVVLLSAQGCSGITWQDTQGNEYHLIVGVGLVTLNHGSDGKHATVQSSRGLGLQYLTDPPRLAIGYSSLSSIAIPDGVDSLCAEISQVPLQPMTVKSCDLINLTSLEDP